MRDSTRLTDALRDRVLVADGAMGTMLQAAGLGPGIAPELWNRDRPEAVLAVHAAYVAAGADLIVSNTFGGTRIKLARYGLADEMAELNTLGVQLAREAVGTEGIVLGDLGSTGELLEPLGTLTFSQAREAYAEQVEALAAGGADAIILETMLDVQEARAGILGAHDVCDLPVICTFSFDRNRRTIMGATTAAVAELWAEGLALIGANCGHSLESNLAAVAELREHLPGATLMAKPNAGVPALGEDGRTHFDVGPEEMAAFARRFLDQGVRIIGGCCGSTPAHIAAIAKMVKTDS